jgi:hypothetical protein
MNREEVNREKVIQTVREATTLPETLSSTSMKTIKRVAEEYVSERNENCSFQPAYVRKAIAEKSCQVREIRRA